MHRLITVFAECTCSLLVNAVTWLIFDFKILLWPVHQSAILTAFKYFNRMFIVTCDKSFSFFFSLTRIKKGYPYEARVIARVLPAFLADFFPPQDIMNKVIGEFLSSQQPYPQLIAKVVFQVKSIFLFYKRTVKQFHSRQITASLVFVYFLIKVYIVGTHLNCIDLSIHFKCVPTLYAFIKKIRRKKNIKVYFIYLPYLSLTYLS